MKKRGILPAAAAMLDAVVLAAAWFAGWQKIFESCVFYSLLALLGWLAFLFFRAADRVPMQGLSMRWRWALVLAAGVLVLVCVLPMGLPSMWNYAQGVGHRNQYELMTQAILKGQLHLDLELHPRFAALENPYDPLQRLTLVPDVEIYWDHAYYEGHYYMYFGVVPVFLAFLPYQLITGTPMAGYQATQLFVACLIPGIFALFALLARRFFPKLSLGRYVAMTAATSGLSVWYSINFPALYCTAITSAICLEVWSLYFFVRAVWVEERENRQILHAFFGALLGALAFGCRPPVALANLLVLPMLAAFLKQRRLTAKRLGKLVLAALPYVAVAALLMLYNQLRFDNPFEFGQSYQITVEDQRAYGNAFERLAEVNLLKGLKESFLAPMTRKKYGGALVIFPALWTGLGMLLPRVRKTLREKGILGFAYTLFALPLLITLIDVLWSPEPLERYHMDVYYLMGLCCFVASGACAGRKPRLQAVLIYGLSALTLATCVLFFFFPYDYNWISGHPEVVEKLKALVSFGIKGS